MKDQPYSRVSARLTRWLFVCVVAFASVSSANAQGVPGSPVLLTEGTGTTTRGVAYEAVTFRSEPFSVVSPFNWNADKSNTRDQQTRVMLFVMNRSEEHTSELQSQSNLVCRLLLEKKKKKKDTETVKL